VDGGEGVEPGSIIGAWEEARPVVRRCLGAGEEARPSRYFCLATRSISTIFLQVILWNQNREPQIRCMPITSALVLT